MSVPGRASVDQIGAFTYSIPIVVPPGTRKMAPVISLNYSSAAGDGFEGLGWSVAGLSAITRCPRTLAQDQVHGGVNYDLNDRYCLDGERLILISGVYGKENSQYRTEVDGFTKIIADCVTPGDCTSTNGPDYFEAHTKSGRILYFGKSTNSRVMATGTSTPREWLESENEDLLGNYFSVTYKNDTTNGQAYPLEIDYTANDGTTPKLNTYNSVVFAYMPRNDQVTTYRAGSKIKMTVLLSNIETFNGPDLVSNYILQYNQAATSSAQHNELKSVTRCADLAGTDCLAATTFGWQGTRDVLTMSSVTIPGDPSEDKAVFPGDWNADGLTDILVPTGACIESGTQTPGVFVAGGYTAKYTQWVDEEGQWQAVPYSGPPCFNSFPVFDRPTSIDFSGDGFSDITISQFTGSGTILSDLLNDKSGTLSEVTNSALPGAGPLGIADFNGDGRSDIVASNGSNASTWVSDGDGTFTVDGGYTVAALAFGDFDGDGCMDGLKEPSPSAIVYSCQPAVATAPTPDFSSGTVVTGDFNGDGNDDVLFVKASGTGTLYYSTGTGLVLSDFALPATWTTTNYQFRIGDFNGDGKMDLALISSKSTANSLIYLSTGTGFVAAPASGGGTISIAANGKGTVADWNNDGAADLWIQSTGVDTEYNFAYIPEMIHTVSNGLCQAACPMWIVTYDRLNHGTIYTKDSSATYPTQDTVNAAYVVSEIDANNAVGGTNSVTYAYEGAQTDVNGRGFLGFSKVTSTDNRTGIVTATSYNTLFPLTGTPSQVKVSHTVGSTTTVLSNTNFTFMPTAFPAIDSTRYVVELTSMAQVAHKDLDGSALPKMSGDYTYDGFANPHVVTKTITGTDGSTSTSTTTNTWLNNTTGAAWVLAQLQETTTENVVGTSDLTRDTTFVTDHSTGLVLTATVEPGVPALKLETDYQYDKFGNVHFVTQSGHQIATRTTTFNFDTTNGEFLDSVDLPTPSSGVQQSVSFTSDIRFGSLLTQVDVNGLTTSMTYDEFGRLTLRRNPDNTALLPTYQYCSGIDGGTLACTANGAYRVTVLPVLCANPGCTSPSTIGPFRRTTVDLLQRPLLNETQGFDATTIQQSTKYDTHLHVQQTSRPIFAGGAFAYTTYRYDALDRVTEEDFPDTSTTQFGYDGLVATVTNDLGQTTTRTMNQQGLVGSTADALGTETSFSYDAFGDPTSIVAPGGHAITNTFDIRGRKLSTVDFDMGSGANPWTYTYDALSELLTQTDANGNTTTIGYDVLGRMTSRVEADMTSTWLWDTAANGVGELAQTCNAAACAGASYVYTPVYDTLGRVKKDTLAIDGTNYIYQIGYDGDGRLDHVIYPSGFRADYNYTVRSYLTGIQDDATASAIWTANAADAELHLTQSTAGPATASALISSYAYDPDTGRLETIKEGTAADLKSVANLGYSWDTIGNLSNRIDHKEGTTESFCYDDDNRLTSYGLTTATACPVTAAGAVTMSYSSQGNLTGRSDVGTYSYGAGTVGSHAVTSIAGTVDGIVNPSFLYDANGNLRCMTPDGACDSTAGLAIQWNSFNMVSHVRDNPRAVNFDMVYDTAHSRIKRCSPNCTSPQSTTLYLNDPATGTMEEANISGGTTSWTDYIAASGGIVAIRNSSGTTSSYLYVTGDHLGSVSLISDASGSLIAGGRQSYDPWGQRRNPDGTPASSCSAIASATTRGYTGQEEMDSGCLVNLNGRIYYPVIGRMLSADPTVPNPLDGQSYNRYSYVNNNPLNATDPSGYIKSPCPSGVCQFTDQKCIVCDTSDNNPAAFLSAGQAGTFFAEAASSSITCVGSACGVRISGTGSIQAFEQEDPNDPNSPIDVADPIVTFNYSFFESLSDFEASGFNNGLGEQTFDTNGGFWGNNSTTVDLRFREVILGGWDTGRMHGFIVVRNNLTGKQWVSQGGPSYDVPCAYCLLPLPSDQSWTEPYTSSNTGYNQPYVSVSSFTTDLSSDAIVGQLSQFSNEFNSEELPYLYPTPNSNFYAGEAWQNLTGSIPALPSNVNAPGWPGPQ